MFKTLRRRIAFLLIAANLPVIIFAIVIGRQELAVADQYEHDRLVQAAELISARAAGALKDAATVPEQRAALFANLGASPELHAALVGADGHVIVADDGASSTTWLSAGGPPTIPTEDDPRVMKARGPDGRAYHYVVADIWGRPDRVVVASPFHSIGRSEEQWMFLALGLPALMVLLCVGLVLFGLERFLLRWIRLLRAIAASYDGGRIDARTASLKGAPQELAELADALEAMARRVDERSTALEAALEGRDRLLRELHHRVKNNFQMIASLLALQRQEAPETLSAVLRAPEDRVRAMAAAYKVSYASGEIGHVGVAALVRDVAMQARQTSGGRTFDVSAHFPEEEFEIDLDFAVSLALLLTELLSAASVASPTAMITAEPWPDGKIALTITGPQAGWIPETGLSQRLIHAYSDQLSTGLEEREGGAIRLIVLLAKEKPAIGMKTPERKAS